MDNMRIGEYLVHTKFNMAVIDINPEISYLTYKP